MILLPISSHPCKDPCFRARLHDASARSPPTTRTDQTPQRYADALAERKCPEGASVDSRDSQIARGRRRTSQTSSEPTELRHSLGSSYGYSLGILSGDPRISSRRFFCSRPTAEPPSKRPFFGEKTPKPPMSMDAILPSLRRLSKDFLKKDLRPDTVDDRGRNRGQKGG